MARYYADAPSSDELYHYGVKGMKWGKHKKRIDYLVGETKGAASVIGEMGRNAYDNTIRNGRVKRKLTGRSQTWSGKYSDPWDDWRPISKNKKGEYQYRSGGADMSKVRQKAKAGHGKSGGHKMSSNKATGGHSGGHKMTGGAKIKEKTGGANMKSVNKNVKKKKPTGMRRG